MSEAKDLANKLVAEVKDSAHLFFTPVRVIVTEFNRAVHQPTSHDSGPESQKSHEDSNFTARAG
jgi:hypothetical protein